MCSFAHKHPRATIPTILPRHLSAGRADQNSPREQPEYMYSARGTPGDPRTRGPMSTLRADRP
eukprot:3235186-Rhodomonas_salina.1